MKLEDRLAALRQEKELSQTDVAEALDISRQAISRWESGAAVPSMENLMKLSGLYNVPLDAFVRDWEEETGSADGEGPKPEPGATCTREESKRGNRRVLAAVFVLLAILAAVFWYYTAEKKSQEMMDIGELETNGVEIYGTFDFGS